MSAITHLVTLALPIVMLAMPGYATHWTSVFVAACVAASLHFRGTELATVSRPRYLMYSPVLSMLIPPVWGLLALVLVIKVPTQALVCFGTYVAMLVVLTLKKRIAGTNEKPPASA